MDYLIDTRFQGVIRLFVLLFNAIHDRTGHSTYCLPTAKVENYNVTIHGRNFFAQPIKNDIKTYEKNSKYYNWSKRWLHKWLFARLQLFQRTLLNDGNRYK